jgi:hypothetical protein
MKTFKQRVYLVLLDRLLELEAALAEGFHVQQALWNLAPASRYRRRSSGLARARSNLR